MTSHSNALGTLTMERLVSAASLVNQARIALEVLDEHGALIPIGGLPPRLAVLEGLLMEAAAANVP